MKIGKLALDIKPPADLDAQLIALAGVNAAEMAVILAGPCIASTVATALTPFVGNTPPVPVPVLAEAIGEAGVDPIRAETARLYAKQLKAGGAHGETQG